MMDPKFRHINRLLVFSFKNSDISPARYSFEAYERLVEMSGNEVYTTGSLLDFL